MNTLPFTHLHVHTEYSLLDGANKIEQLAKRIKELGMDSCAITDHGVMFGAIHFYKTLKKEGVKPIIGIEAYVHNQEDIGDKSTKQRFHVCLLAKNEVGYKNLMYLSSQAFINGFYYYPRINKKLLKEHSEGLICTSACLQGEVNWNLNTNRSKNVEAGAGGYTKALEVASWYKDVFGDDFYLELMRHGIDDQEFIDSHVLRISRELDIKVIATNDTHYRMPDDSEAHEAFMCIAMNKLFDDPNRMRHSVHEFYIKSPQELSRLYADIPEALINTQEIVQKCDLDLKLGSPTPPSFKFVGEYKNENGQFHTSDDELFVQKCREGLEKRLEYIPQERHEEYRQRLEVEMVIIQKMKFSGYMLIVWDFVRQAKELDIPVGPGRGSAAGSLVAYALQITNIDPIPYNLLFERFLNPERVSMPDIDMDFCQDRRGEIIEYVVQKYGRHNVAQVITFGSLLAKGVIRDVARVLDMPYADADRLAKLIPEKLGITLKDAYEAEPKIKEAVESDPKIDKIWQFALALEGLKRNAGTHAAGVVISNEELWHKTPLYKPSGDNDTLATQYDGRFLEDVDLIKFDFLGLKTLTVIDNAVKIIEATSGKKIDLATLPMDDEDVFKMIQSGHTLGLFQIESGGMQGLVTRLKPTTFEDLIAILALYRPGPMESGMLDDFIERKHGRREVVYDFADLEPILAPTYGVIVYQEQVMQIVQTIGGFSLGEADIVRRAMGKKQIEYMQQKKAQFAEGAAAKGLDPKKAADLFDLIEKFAGYGFNKSHSAAYALITYQTAYLKTHHETAFMAALLSSEKDNTDKIVKYIDEIKRLGVELLPPDITRSAVDFLPAKNGEKEAILFGLGAIKGVGEAALESIIRSRGEKPFDDLPDFLCRIDMQKVNKRVLESLVKAGAADGFGHTRRTLLVNIETIVEHGQDSAKMRNMAQGSLFGDDEEISKLSLELKRVEEYDPKTILELEKETLGFYVSGHPLDPYRNELSAISYTLSSDLENVKDGAEAMFIGKVEEIKTKISKKGNKFGIVTLMDLHGSLEITLFDSFLAKLEELDISSPIGFLTRVDKDEQFTRISVRSIMSLEEAKTQKVRTKAYSKPKGKQNINSEPQRAKETPPPAPIEQKPVAINLLIDIERNPQIIDRLNDIIAAHPGKQKLYLTLETGGSQVRLETPYYVDASIRNSILAAVAPQTSEGAA